MSNIDNVKEWKQRKALHEVDPILLLKRGQGNLIEYCNSSKQIGKYFHIQVKCNNVLLVHTKKAVMANKRYYIPIFIKNALYGYPNPKTHVYLKNHITFLTAKDAIIINVYDNKVQELPYQPPTLALLNKMKEKTKRQSDNDIQNDSLEFKSLKKIQEMTNNNNGGGINSFTFSKSKMSVRFLKCFNNSNKTIICHTNSSRSSQGTAFIEPSVKHGEYKEISFHIDNKPGRMCYFFGCCRVSKLFHVDAGQSIIRQNAISLENLYGTLHKEQPSTEKALPSFHTGSIVKLIADRRSKDVMDFFVVIDTTGKRFHVNMKNFQEEVVFFVSLYNNKAKITIL
eukprot:g1494.t1